jgi:hypothetical protein
VVGAKGFEPSTSWSRTRRASQAALRPDMSAPPYLGARALTDSLSQPRVASTPSKLHFLRDRLERREFRAPFPSPDEHTFDSIYQLKFVDPICRSSSQSPKIKPPEDSRLPAANNPTSVSARTHSAMQTASRAGWSIDVCTARTSIRKSPSSH